MAYEDIFKHPYWRSFKRDYEMKHGGKIDLNTGRIIPNTKASSIFSNIPSTPGNTFGGYGSIYFPNPSTYNQTITGYGTTNKSIPGMSTHTVSASNPSLMGKLKAAGKIAGPALGIVAAIPEVLFGKNMNAKALSTAGAVAGMNPATAPFSIPLFLGAGLNNYIGKPEYQINKSNKDFAKYEAQFGTPDNPNIGNLAPALKTLTEDELAMLQFKDNMQQAQREQSVAPQEVTSQTVAATPEQYKEAANKITADSVDAQNQLTDMANSLQPQPVKYNSAVYGENIYNPSPGLSAMTENRIDQMNQAIQDVPNLFNNLYGQGNVDVGSNALSQYLQMLGQQQQAKQELAQQMLAGYQAAAKKDRYQQLLNNMTRAYDDANYRSSLVFIPSGFSPNGGQTFTPMYLNPKPGEQAAPDNVAKYMQELQLRQSLAPDNSAQNQAMEKALQAQALGEATGYNPMIFIGNENLAKEMMSQIIGPQVKDVSDTRAVLAKLGPETYGKLVEIGGKAYADSVVKRMEKEYDIAQKNIEQSAMTDRANAEEQNKFFMNYMNKNVSLAKQAMSDQSALERLKLTGMNNEQLAILKADLDSSDPVKQMNAAAQVMNAFTRFATPQEAQSYQNQIFPQGLPQFTNRRSP